jgi:hypothetical protein
LSANPFSAGSVTIESSADIIIDLAQNLYKISDTPSAALNLIAKGNIVYVNSNYSNSTTPGRGHTIGDPVTAFSNRLNMTAVNSIVLNNSLYVGSQGMSLAAGSSISTPFQTVAGNPAGDVTLLGNYVVRTAGDLAVTGRNFSLLGYGNVDPGTVVANLGSAPLGTNAPGEELTVGGTINLMNSGVIAVEAGTATAAVASGSHLKATTINIGSSGSSTNPTQLRIVGGVNNNFGLSTTNPNDPNVSVNQADAIMEASGTLTAFLRHDSSLPGAADPFGNYYSLIVQGGQAQASDAGVGFRIVTALGALRAHDMQLSTDGSVLIQGGSSTLGANSGQTMSGGPGAAFVASGGLVVVDAARDFTTGGSVVIRGGTTNVSPSAIVDPRNAVSLGQLDPSTLTLDVGGAVLLEAGHTLGASGSLAFARIDAGDLIVINVTGPSMSYTYNNTQSGPKTLSGHFFMIGGSSSGLFDRNNQVLPGTSSPVTINVPVQFDADPGLGSSIIQTGLQTFNNALLSYIIFAANEETRAARFRKVLGDSDDPGAPACK